MPSAVPHATVGGVTSILISGTVSDSELPARSVQVPLTDCPAPWVATTTGGGGVPAAKPEIASEHWKVIVTGELFQLSPFGSGDRMAEMCGAVWSILNATECVVSVLPA